MPASGAVGRRPPAARVMRDPRSRSRSISCRLRGSCEELGHRLGDGGPDAGHRRRSPRCRRVARASMVPKCRARSWATVLPDVPDARARRAAARAAAPSRPRSPAPAAPPTARRTGRAPTSRSAVRCVEVGHVADQPGVEQLPHPLVAQPADVHRVARGEVHDALEHPAGAGDVGAEAHRPRPPGARPAVPQPGSGRASRTARSLPSRRSRSGPSTWGITSPARTTSTQSPSRMSFWAMTSSLCRVARATR